MREQLNRLIHAYQNFYGLTKLEAIKFIRQDLADIARHLKPVKSERRAK